MADHHSDHQGDGRRRFDHSRPIKRMMMDGGLSGEADTPWTPPRRWNRSRSGIFSVPDPVSRARVTRAAPSGNESELLSSSETGEFENLENTLYTPSRAGK